MQHFSLSRIFLIFLKIFLQRFITSQA
jgi:hypothetical protein